MNQHHKTIPRPLRNLCLYVCTFVSMHVCMHAYVCICVYVYAYIQCVSIQRGRERQRGRDGCTAYTLTSLSLLGRLGGFLGRNCRLFVRCQNKKSGDTTTCTNRNRMRSKPGHKNAHQHQDVLASSLLVTLSRPKSAFPQGNLDFKVARQRVHCSHTRPILPKPRPPKLKTDSCCQPKSQRYMREKQPPAASRLQSARAQICCPVSPQSQPLIQSLNPQLPPCSPGGLPKP